MASKVRYLQKKRKFKNCGHSLKLLILYFYENLCFKDFYSLESMYCCIVLLFELLGLGLLHDCISSVFTVTAYDILHLVLYENFIS